VKFAFLGILTMRVSQLRFLCLVKLRYFAESTVFRTWPWIFYSTTVGDFLLVTRSISHFFGLNCMSHRSSQSWSLFRSLCNLAWSSGVLILLYIRQSSAKSLVVDDTDDDRSLMKIKESSGPRTVP
jgi:hypothetical protein